MPLADQGSTARGQKLADLSLKTFPSMPLGESALKIIRNIDVVWIRNKSIEAAFEVESTTSIYSGLLRLSDLLASQPNISVRLFLLAEEKRRKEVQRNVTRPTFADLDLPNRVLYISFEKLIAEHENLIRYAESPAILERISEEFSVPTEDNGGGGGNGGDGKKPRVTWEAKLKWADPKVASEFLPKLQSRIKRDVAPELTTRTVGRWLYFQDGKPFCVLWVKKRGFMVSVASDESFRDSKGISHTVKGFFFPPGHERRFSLVMGDDVDYGLKLIAEGHRIAKLPSYPWTGTRRPTR